MSSKHTPGPWTFDDANFILSANGDIVAEVPCQGANPNDLPLIANAPALYHAGWKLVAEVSAAIHIGEEGLRETLGTTNLNVLKLRLGEMREVLHKAESDQIAEH